MAKLKAPLLSFGATGTVGQALTVSRWKGLSVAKRVPTHPDAKTAAQLVQRELYSHARDYWHTLTLGERASLLTEARPFHITGYNLLLRQYLLDRLNLEAWWPLNDGGPPSAHDYSLHNTHGTVYGCIAADDFCGQPNNALWFDGINDRVVATTPQLDFTSTDFSIVLRLKTDSLASLEMIFSRGLYQVDGYYLFANTNGVLEFDTNQTGQAQATATYAASIVIDTWYTIGMTRISAAVNIYINGVDQTDITSVHQDPLPSARTLKIGIYDDDISNPFTGTICDVKPYSRGLTPAQHLAVHQRYCVHPPR